MSPRITAPPPVLCPIAARASRRARGRCRPAAIRCSLCASTAEGIFAEVVAACAGGAVLTGWALYLRAGPLVLGVLGALPLLAQLVHLPAAWITASLGRRRVAIGAVAAAREAYLPLVALPFLPIGDGAKLSVLLAVAGASSLLGAIANNAWFSWMGDLVPGAIRGRYFGRRTAICAMGGAAASLAAGTLLDRSKLQGRAGAALAALALVACLSGAITAWLMAHQVDLGRERGAALKPDWARALQPFRDPKLRPLLVYQVAWNAAVGLAAAFFNVHMLDNLRMGFALVSLQLAGTAGARVLSVPLWGRALDRVGARPVLILCSFGIGFVPLVYLLPTPQNLWPLALDSLMSGALWSGHSLASFALPMSLGAPRDRPFTFAAVSAAGGIAFALSSALAGAVAQQIPRDLLVLGRPMFGLQVLFVLSSVARLCAASLALRIAEHQARPVDALLQLGASALRTRLARLPASLLLRR